MSETHQNIDKYWVSHMCAENRVAGNHLSTEQPPITRLLNLDNGNISLIMLSNNSKEKIMQTLSAG